MRWVYTTRRYAECSICRHRVSVCHTPVLYQMAKHTITQIMPHDSPMTLVFCAKHRGEIPTGSPPTGQQMQAEWVKIGYFRRKTHCNSKTVRDRCVVSIKVE